ncbi:MAG: phenylalanine--tRNA ligase beta subunit-related protein, partial [Phycisphaerales bacterium]
MATWDTVSVRNTGRRLQIRTDAAFRFERGIDPRTIDYAARRAAALICEVSGGQLAQGVLSEGPPLPADTAIALRPERCDLILGIHTEPAEIAELLNALSFRTTIESDGTLTCVIPPHRSHDVTREIDLIEEVARARSLAVVPVHETLPVRAREPQMSERAMGAIARTLTSLGFFETVTFSFTAPEKGELFRREGTDLVSVDDDRRKAEPTLRPSVLLGLLSTRHANQSARTTTPGGVRLYETAQCFAQKAGTTQTDEYRSLAMLVDVVFEGRKSKHDDLQHAARTMRGSIDAIVRTVFGPRARTIVEPSTPAHRGYDKDAYATVSVKMGKETIALGGYGLISAEALKAHDLEEPLVGAELFIDPLIAAYPPASQAEMLPQFPGIDRDLSLIVDEAVRWEKIDAQARELDLDKCIGWEMMDIFRGKQVGEGKKSVTVRLHFRDDDRTLRHEEVDPQVDHFAQRAKESLGASFRDANPGSA